jgi:hypothetical protein
MRMLRFRWRTLSGIALFCCGLLLTIPARPAGGDKAPGYRGVWYSIAQGKKVAYSGGLGLYPPHIRPNAIYAAKARKTFFVWGGSVPPNDRHLRIMAGYYDHDKGVAGRPVIVRDCGDFGDAHANPALSIDDAGHLWVGISSPARSTAAPNRSTLKRSRRSAAATPTRSRGTCRGRGSFCCPRNTRPAAKTTGAPARTG